jgi:hypothetical protein
MRVWNRLRAALRRRAREAVVLPPPDPSTRREAERLARQWAYLRRLDRQT